MGLGIALFVLILMGIVTFFLPLLSVVCIVAAIVMASVLTCGCCCAGEYHLKPHVRKWAVATLVTLSLTFAVSVVGIGITFAVACGKVSDADVTTAAYSGAAAVLAIVLLLEVLALVFSVLFTWGRNCGAPRSLG